MQKGKQQAESSSEDKTDQQICNSPVFVQRLCKVSPLQETNSATSPLCHKRPSIPVLSTPVAQRPSTIAPKMQQSLPVSTNMAITTTSATTMVQPSVQATPAGTTTPSATTADQRVRDRL